MNYTMKEQGAPFRALTLARPRSLALLGLCVAGLCLTGLALSASAQSPTLADWDAMRAEFDASHQRTLASIEQAEADIKPVSAWAHLPPDAIALEAYVGKLLLSVESGWAMKVVRTPKGTPRVLILNIDATPVGGFDLGPKQSMATSTSTLYDLQQIAFADCPANGQPRSAGVSRDGSGVTFGWSCGGDRRGQSLQYFSYSLESDGPGIKAKFFTSNDNGMSNISEHAYLPISNELLAAASARLVQRREEERLRQEAVALQKAEQEREKRRLSQERVRSFNRTMEGFGGVLNGAVAEVGT